MCVSVCSHGTVHSVNAIYILFGKAYHQCIINPKDRLAHLLNRCCCHAWGNFELMSEEGSAIFKVPN